MRLQTSVAAVSSVKMRLTPALLSALYSSAALLGQVRADEEAEDVSSTSVAESSTSSSIEKPTFTVRLDCALLCRTTTDPTQPSNIKAPFFEQFTDDWDSRWAPSHAKKEDSKTTEEWAYVGTWAVEEPSVFKAIEGDKGLVVKNPAAHHAISAKFDEAIDSKGKTLVVQYEVKLQSNSSNYPSSTLRSEC